MKGKYNKPEMIVVALRQQQQLLTGTPDGFKAKMDGYDASDEKFSQQ